MNKKHNTLVVNLLGGPGSGKSTTAAHIFAHLKLIDINCELIGEYAKDLVWEHRHKTFENQIYMFGKQHHKIYRVLGQVDVIVTDSPILLTPIYDLEKRENLKQLMLDEFNKVHNFDILLKRKKKYQPKGRNQNEEQAKEKDLEIKKFLEDNKIPYVEVDGTNESIDTIVKTITMTVKAINESK